MKLDRNITNPRRGKYALIKLRETTPRALLVVPGETAKMAVEREAIDFGDSEDSDFFVIRLKDKYAAKALKAYADAAAPDDPEYADEVYQLARLASEHPNRKRPD